MKLAGKTDIGRVRAAKTRTITAPGSSPATRLGLLVCDGMGGARRRTRSFASSGHATSLSDCLPRSSMPSVCPARRKRC